MPGSPRRPLQSEPLERRRLFTAPFASVDTYILDEDTSLVATHLTGVLANDSDAEGDPLAATLAAGARHGTLALHPDGSFEYTPDADYFGLDGFAYVAADATGQSLVTDVALNVNPVADAGKLAFNTGGYFAAEESGAGTLTVVRTGGTDTTVTVDYAILPGTATAMLDYLPAGGTLTFTPGVTSQDVSVSLLPDGEFESSETLAVTLTNPTGGAKFAGGVSPVASLTILDDDPAPSVTVADPAPVAEGNPGDSNMIPFVFELSAPSASASIVQFTFGAGSATPGADFDDTAAPLVTPAPVTPAPFTPATVVFAPGQTTATVNIALVADSENELDETLSISLVGATNATIADSIAVGTVVNDDNVAPVAADLTITRLPGAGPTAINLATLVTSPDANTLTLSIVTSPSVGTLSVDDGGTPSDASDDLISYATSGAGFGDNRFSYAVSDAFGGVAAGTVTVQTRGVAFAPLSTHVPAPGPGATGPAAADLLVAGTPGPDVMRLQRTRTRGEVRVTLNGVEQGVFSPAGRIVVSGGEGDDVIDARGSTVGVDLFGDGGNDVLKGGKFSDLLFGGEGDDALRGGDRRDVLVGGAGADVLSGGDADDLLIGGTSPADVTIPDAMHPDVSNPGVRPAATDTPAARAFRAELLALWTSPATPAQRRALLGNAENPVHLASDNVLDDGAVDVLGGSDGSDWFFGTSNPAGTPDRFRDGGSRDDVTEPG